MHPVRAIVAFAFSLALAAAALAQDPPPAPPQPAPGIHWETDYDTALARAQKEQRPLFVAFLMDDEPANDETIKDHYKDPQIQKLLARFVCLVGCLGEHHGTDPGCTKFPGLECAQHQAVEKKARARWLQSDLVCTPQHVFCDPQGNELRRKVYLIGKATLAKCLLLTLTDCGIDTKDLQVDFGKDGAGDLAADEHEKVTQWLADLSSNSLEVRETALRGLGSAEDARALPAVLACCDDKHDQATRETAIGALARKGNHRAVAPLCALLKENKAPLLIEVAEALESIQMPEAVPPLLAAIKKEKRDRVLGMLLRAAARSQAGSDDVRDLCLKALKGASNQLAENTMIALGRLDTDDKIVRACLPRLADRNQNTRGLAVWVLGTQRTKESEKALAALQDTEKTPEVLKLLTSARKHCRGEKVEGYESMHWQFRGDF